MMIKNKKMVIILSAIAALLVLIGIFFLVKNRGANQESQEQGKKKTVLEPKNIILIEERPYVVLSPVAGGRDIDITVVEVKKPATEVEYELEYQSGTLLQGFQEVLSLETLPATTRKLFGSRSAGGAVTYHEDIKGGSLQLRFIGPENYVLKQDWRYFENENGASEFSSKDAKFQITSDDLADLDLILIYNTPGYASGLEGTPVSEPYSLTSDKTLSGQAEIVIRANEEGELKLMGYDGSEWQEIESVVDGKTVTADDAQLMDLYIVVK